MMHFGYCFLEKIEFEKHCLRPEHKPGEACHGRAAGAQGPIGISNIYSDIHVESSVFMQVSDC